MTILNKVISQSYLDSIKVFPKKPATRAEFIYVASAINSDFGFEKFEYGAFHEKSTVTCKKHGDFEATIAEILKGYNYCLGCKRDQRKHEEISSIAIRGLRYIDIRYKNPDFIPSSNDRDIKAEVEYICPIHGTVIGSLFACYLGITCCQKNKKGKNSTTIYVIKLSSEDEVFYKIGITTLDVERRFIWEKNKYDIEILGLYYADHRTALRMEHSLHREMDQHKYTPKKSFFGETECFSENPIHMIKSLCALDIKRKSYA